MFWILATVMLLIALAFVLLPMLRGPRRDSAREALLQAHRAGVIDADEYRTKRDALPAAPTPVPAPRVAIVLVALLLPLGAVLAYRTIGEPRALDPAASSRAAAMDAALAANANGDNANPPDMDTAVTGLAERLKQQPDDLEGWMLLGRAYKAMERFEPARDALANAFRLAPDNPDVMIDYAEALVLASSTRRFEGEPLELLQKALVLQPDSQRGLWLLGASAYQREAFGEAAQTWERLLTLLPADASPRAALVERIANARERAGLPPATDNAATPAPAAASTAAATPSTDAPPATGKASLTVTVDITAELRAKVSDGDVLFVFARAAQGPRMPLAIQRLDATTLPVTVTLDDSTSMMPSMTLSSMPQVVVGARISKTGDAIAKPGDLETLSDPIANTHADPLHLTIDRVVP